MSEQRMNLRQGESLELSTFHYQRYYLSLTMMHHIQETTFASYTRNHHPLPCIQGRVCLFSSREEVHGDIWDQQTWHGRSYYNFLQGDIVVKTFSCAPFSSRLGAGLLKWGTNWLRWVTLGSRSSKIPMLHLSHSLCIIQIIEIHHHPS